MWTYRAKVLNVVDADTLDLLVDLGFSISFEHRVRLARIDAWEIRGPERAKGLIAKSFVEQSLPTDGYVTICTEKKGKFGRYIAEITYADGLNLSDELVKRGHAHYRDY